MKKVRLFAVAAAMGMFASTVAAAETTTGYVATWGEVDEIVKVDVGDKVIAPTATIKVVKETRTTDIEDALDSDYLGLDVDVECYVGNTDVIGTDKNEDSYTDHQIYFINGEEGYFTSVEEAVEAFKVKGIFLAPNAAEREEVTYANKYTGETFADYEEVLEYAVEKGFVEYVYDEDGELTDVLLNKTEVTDKNGNVYGTVAMKVTLENSRYAEEETLEAIAAALVSGTLPTSEYYTATTVSKKNYTKDDNGVTVLPYSFKNADDEVKEINSTYPVLVVEEDRYGDYVVVGRTTKTFVEGHYKHANGTNVEIDETKYTVLVREEASRGSSEEFFYNKLMTIKPTTAKKWTPVSKMVWDEEVGNFVKEELSWDTYAQDLTGFWWENPVEWDDEYEENNDAETLLDVDLFQNTLGLVEVPVAVENTSDKYVIYDHNITVTALNTKNGKMTIDANGTELSVYGVELEDGWYPAVNTEAELSKVVAKLYGIGKFDMDSVHDGLTDDYIEALEDGTPITADNGYALWYEATEELAKNPWSGFSFEGDLPYNELRGASSKQCTYKVASGEEVTATVSASEVDTNEAGVKTLTLTASVDGKAVATKDVKVVVAPRYERTYVNGKVAVLKSFYLDGTLYSEYHYDWAAKTYTATFYANDGVTVASTANGTL